MTREELRGLQPGDAVRWGGLAGEVTGKRNGRPRVDWADGAAEWLGWRSTEDRDRVLDIVKEERRHGEVASHL